MMELLLMKTRHGASLLMFSTKTFIAFELNVWIHLSVTHRGPPWKYHHPLHVWLSDLSITCENAEKRLPENCEESNHEMTVCSGEGGSRWGKLPATRALAWARVTMRVQWASSVTGQSWHHDAMLNSSFSPAYGNMHREEVTKFKPIMWITFQALLSPRVLSNAFEVSRSAICWTVRPQKRVRFPHVLKHVLNTAQCRCLVCSGNISCSGAMGAEEVPWRNKGRLSGGGSTVQWLGLPCAKLSTAPQGPWCTTALA